MSPVFFVSGSKITSFGDYNEINQLHRSGNPRILGKKRARALSHAARVGEIRPLRTRASRSDPPTAPSLTSFARPRAPRSSPRASKKQTNDEKRSSPRLVPLGSRPKAREGLAGGRPFYSGERGASRRHGRSRGLSLQAPVARALNR